MGCLKRREWTIRRYGPGLTLMFLAGVWPRAGLAEEPAQPRLNASADRPLDPDLRPADPPPDSVTETNRPATHRRKAGWIPEDPEERAKLESLGLQLDRAAAANHALGQLLPRQREVDRRLARARDHLDRSDYDEAITLLQTVFDAPDDCITHSLNSADGLLARRDTLRSHKPASSQATNPDKNDASRTDDAPPPPALSLRPARIVAMQLLRDHAEALEHYRRAHESAAAALVSAASHGDEQAAYEVRRRYPLTLAAINFELRQAALYIDSGQITRGRFLLNRIAARPSLSGKQLDRLARLTAACVPTSATREPDRLVQLASTERTAPNLRSATFESPITHAAVSSRDEQPTRNDSTSTAILPPVWVRTHMEGVDDPETRAHVEHVVGNWLADAADQHSEVGPPGPQRPVFVSGNVIYRDFTSIVALAVDTGDLVWRRPVSSSLAERLINEDSAADRGIVERELTLDSATHEMTCDESVVYYVERFAETESTLPQSRLCAISAETGSLLWSYRPEVDNAGATAEPIDDKPRTFVLGPPTPTRHGLMLVTEVAGRLELHAVDPIDGSAKWRQSLARADVPGSRDRTRMALSCRPTVAHGLAVCSTQLGTLVAIDTATGLLRWTVRYADLTSGVGGRPRSVATRDFNPRAFVNQPVVHGDTVYALPVQSSQLWALSLETGQVLWSVPRDNDYFIATVDEIENTVVLVGDRFVRGVDRHSAVERWRTRIPPVVGTALTLGHELVLPVASRQLLRLNFRTGKIVDDRWERAAEPLHRSGALAAGSLWSCGDVIFRLGPTQAQMLPLGRRVVASAQADLRSDSSLKQATARIEIARVNLASAQPNTALQHLQQVESRDLTPDVRAEFEHLLRETLFARLTRAADEPFGKQAETFAKLDALADTPEQIGRVLNRKIRSDIGGDRVSDAVRKARQLASLRTGDGGSVLDRHGHTLAVSAAAAEALGTLTSEQHAVLQLGARSAALARPDADPKERREFLSLFGRRPEAGAVHVAVADSLVRRGHVQAAELEFLAAANTGDDASRAMARLGLAGLYARHDLPREAATQWEVLLRNYKDRALGHGQTVASLLEQIPRSNPVKQALRQRLPFPTPAYAASIRLNTHEPKQWVAWYDSMQQKMAPWPGADIDVIDSGRVSNDPPTSQLLVVDRERERFRCHIEVPSYYFHPPSLVHRRTGHVLPIGYYEPFAISVLEDRRLWSLSSSTTSGKSAQNSRNRQKAQVAVVTPTVCVFQQHQALTAVDPLTGELIWRRTGIDRNCGVAFDKACGVFGDADRLTVFESDGIGYQVFRTSTGSRVASGRLEASGVGVRRSRFTGSRRALYITITADGLQYRLWDAHHPDHPATLNLAAGPKLLHYRLDEERIAVVDADQKLYLIDLERGEVTWRAALPEFDWDTTSKLRVFEQDGIVFADLEEAATSTMAQYALPEATVRIPKVDLGGQVTALRPDEDGSAEIIWTKSLGRCSVLTGPEYRLPVLLVAARVRPHQGGYDNMTLRVVRVATGEELARHEELPRTPLYRWKYDVDHRQVELFGPEATITVRMGGVADVARRTHSAGDALAAQDAEPIFVSIQR